VGGQGQVGKITTTKKVKGQQPKRLTRNWMKKRGPSSGQNGRLVQCSHGGWFTLGREMKFCENMKLTC